MKRPTITEIIDVLETCAEIEGDNTPCFTEAIRLLWLILEARRETKQTNKKNRVFTNKLLEARVANVSQKGAM